jgi:hypothetical protein
MQYLLDCWLNINIEMTLKNLDSMDFTHILLPMVFVMVLHGKIGEILLILLENIPYCLYPLLGLDTMTLEFVHGIKLQPD